ncbi:MAG: histone deacetylase [Desulfobacteraceae bacterium]|jgi:acetoin utilization deacetylase AcuC-like enzyme|nr:histone deacetylase [Desulfobacteraceae bacterium]
MLKARRPTGLVFFPAFDWAISPTHPEREERLLYTQDQVFEEGILDIDGIHELKPLLAEHRDIERVHFCVPGVDEVTTESHFISAGGAQAIGNAVLEGRVACGFALVRPPGHHAMRVVHGARGFCNINIEAVMIESLRSRFGVQKVAVVDTDCHHGDGTQDIYWHDPDTLFISIHQDGRTLYPGSGFPQEMGGPNAVGTTVNVPLPPYTSEEGILAVARQLILPILADFEPDLIVNSAGQDNHYSDPITNMNFSAQGYAELTRLLAPDICVLEGGYAIEGALPYVNAGIILALAGLDTHRIREPDYHPERIRQPPEVNRWVDKICDAQMENWEQRSAFRDRILGTGQEFSDRTRPIFYDTDGIREEQRERVRLCPDCGGVWRIDSVTDRNARILAVHIPRGACRDCRETGYRWFEEGKPDPFRQVALQDRSADRYTVKPRR